MEITQGETLTLCTAAASAASVEFRFGGAAAKSLPAAIESEQAALTADTAQWSSGDYVWQAWATYADASKKIVSSGSFSLLPGLSVGDSRTPARRIVGMIEAMIEGNAAKGVRSYKINNRELERYSVSELLQLLDYWRRRMFSEERKEKNAASFAGPRITVRF